MGVFMEHHLGVQIAIAMGIRAVENVHLNATGKAVKGRSEISVIESAAVLGVCLHGLGAAPTASEIIVLGIAGGFGETEVIQLIVHPVAPVKERDNRSIAVGGRILGQIQGQVENATWIALGTREVGLI